MSSRLFSASTDQINCGSATTIDDIFASPGGIITANVFTSGLGGSSLGFICTKASDVNGTGGWTFGVMLNVSSWVLRFSHGFSTTTGVWRGDTDLVHNGWASVGVTYNNAAVGNVPTFRVIGLGNITTTITAPVGTASSDAAQSLILGNDATNARQWSGNIAHFWGFKGNTLGNASRTFVQLRFIPASINKPSIFLPLWGTSPEADYSGNNNSGTLTGTTADTSRIAPIDALWTMQNPNNFYASPSAAAAPAVTAKRLPALGAGK